MAWGLETNIKGPAGPPGPQGPAGAAGASDWADIANKPATFPPTLPIPSSGVTGLDAAQSVQDTAIAGKAPAVHTHAESDVTNLVSDLALKAPLASPTFTGDPKSVTPATADNDTSIATTAYVKANLATIVGGAIISDTAPANPQVGQLWFESDTGNTFIFYQDADSSQWVQVSGAVSARPTAETRNRVVNGAMQISQELGNSGSGSADTYMCDNWLVSWAGIAGVTAARRQTYASPSGNWNHLFTDFNTAKASLAAGDYAGPVHPIEGIRLADFGWGAAGAKQAVLRFTVRVPVAGTYTVSIRNAAVNRTYLATYTISAGEVGIDVVKTLVIPGDVTGTWPIDTNKGMSIHFNFACGTTNQSATVGSWFAGSALAATGQANAASVVASATITDVGLYLDPLASGTPPAWTMPDEAQELAACMRYWQKASGNHPISGYAPAVGYNAFEVVFLPTQMRSTPAVTIAGPVNTNATGPTNAAYTSKDTFSAYITSAAAGPYSSIYQPILNARM